MIYYLVSFVYKQYILIASYNAKILGYPHPRNFIREYPEWDYNREIYIPRKFPGIRYIDSCIVSSVSSLPNTNAQDILIRLPQLLASIFEDELKIDSTKKVWCTRCYGGPLLGLPPGAPMLEMRGGEVPVSVLTESEGLEGLHCMATGLIWRFTCCEISTPLLSTQVPEG